MRAGRARYDRRKTRRQAGTHATHNTTRPHLRVEVGRKVVGDEEPVVADVHVGDRVDERLEVLLVAKRSGLDVGEDLVKAKFIEGV